MLYHIYLGNHVSDKTYTLKQAKEKVRYYKKLYTNIDIKIVKEIIVEYRKVIIGYKNRMY